MPINNTSPDLRPRPVFATLLAALLIAAGACGIVLLVDPWLRLAMGTLGLGGLWSTLRIHRRLQARSDHLIRELLPLVVPSTSPADLAAATLANDQIIQGITQKMGGLQEEIQRLTAKQASQEARTQELMQEAVREQQTRQSLTEEIDRQRQEIVHWHQQIAALPTTHEIEGLAQSQEALAAAHQTIKHHRHAMEQLEHRLFDATKERDRLQETIVTLAEEAQEQRQMAAQLTARQGQDLADIASKNRIIADQAWRLTRDEEEAGAWRSVMEKREQETDQLRVKLVDRTRELERARSELNLRTRELEKNSAILINRNYELDASKVIRQDQAAELKLLRQRLAQQEEQHLQGKTHQQEAEEAMHLVQQELVHHILELEGDRALLTLRTHQQEWTIAELERQKIALDQHAVVSITDADSRILYANDKFCEISQYQRSELIGQHHRVIKSNYHPHEYFQQMWQTITAGKTWHGTICNRRKDGGLYWVEGTIVPFLDASGHPYQYVSIRTDITRQKEAEAEAHRLAEETRRLAEEARSMALFAQMNPAPVFRIDGQGIILAANPAATTILGLERIIGHSLPQLAPWAHPLDFAATIRQNETIHFGLQTGDHYYYFLVQGVAELGVCHIYGSEITQAREAERKLDQSLHFLQQITEHMGEGVYALDNVGRLTFLNQEAEQLLGWKRDELLGQYLHDIIHFQSAHGDHASEECPVLQILRTGQSRRVPEDVFTHQSGLLIPVSYVASPLWENEQVIGSVTVFQDISQRKQVEQEIRMARDVALEVSRMKSEFLANMSHEIRTPMNGVIGMTDILLGTRLNKEQRELAVTVKESAQALLTILNDILEFSQIEAGKMEVVSNEFNPPKLAASVAELMTPQAQRKGLTLTYEVEGTFPDRLQGDQGRIRQVLLNLVGNAVKFTDKGGITVRTILMDTTTTHTNVRFAVTDTGIGIPKEFRHRLFQPFSQVDGSNTRHFGGTGLGLSISARLVELMGGEIGMESKKGKGSTFWFQLPLLAEGTAESPHHPSAATWLRGVKALVVDPNHTSQTLLLNHLLYWNMRATAVDSADEAWSLLNHEADSGNFFDLLIVDGSTDWEGNLELGRRLASNPMFVGIQRVLFTNINDENHFQTAREAGFPILLVKPFRRNQLSESLIALIHPEYQPDAPLLHTSAPDPVDVGTLPSTIPRNRLILLAEDNVVYQKVTQRLLQQAGYSVHTSANGKEAVRATEVNNYGLILMDCMMPVMNGFEAANQIREIEAARIPTQRTPIIAMTATPFNTKGEANTCLGPFMDDYLTKPVAPEELKSKLAKWLGDEPTD